MNQPPEKNIAVIHLVWLPYGIKHFYAFINSYLQFTAGYPHQLVIVFNGSSFQHPNQPAEYIVYLKEKGIDSYASFYFDSGQDLVIYKNVAATAKAELLLFLNSFSEIRNNDWLKNYVVNFTGEIGIIGATGSLQSYYSSVFQKNTWQYEKEKGFTYNFRKYKLFMKAMAYWRFLFKPFPNSHIRTNAFMVRRDEFLQAYRGKISSKFEAYLFESGRKSLTNFYLNKGFKVLVIDKYGKTYSAEEWHTSSTFWINNQENLLVSDNQTTIYQQAGADDKKLMTKLAWGINE